MSKKILLVTLLCLATLSAHGETPQTQSKETMGASMANPPSHEVVASKIRQVEDEMKRIGLWQSQPLPPEAYSFRAAFGADTMTFAQWLQFIFIPNVNAIIQKKGNFPSKSQVATMAAREFNGSQYDKLQQLLSEFDALFH